jgi:hypothetical protein
VKETRIQAEWRESQGTGKGCDDICMFGKKSFASAWKTDWRGVFMEPIQKKSKGNIIKG